MNSKEWRKLSGSWKIFGRETTDLSGMTILVIIVFFLWVIHNLDK